MITKLPRRQSTPTPVHSNQTNKHVLLMIPGDAQRTVIGDVLRQQGHEVTSHGDPRQALLSLISNPTIRHVIVAGELTCDHGNALFQRARRFKKPITALSSDESCVSGNFISGLVSC